MNIELHKVIYLSTAFSGMKPVRIPSDAEY